MELFEIPNQLNHCVAKWFNNSKRSNRITYRESFDLDRKFGAGSQIFFSDLIFFLLNSENIKSLRPVGLQLSKKKRT